MGLHPLWGQRRSYNMSGTGALVLDSTSDPRPLFVSPVLGSLIPPSSSTYVEVS